MALKPKRKEGGKQLGVGRLEDLLSVFSWCYRDSPQVNITLSVKQQLNFCGISVVNLFPKMKKIIVCGRNNFLRIRTGLLIYF